MRLSRSLSYTLILFSHLLAFMLAEGRPHSSRPYRPGPSVMIPPVPPGDYPLCGQAGGVEQEVVSPYVEVSQPGVSTGSGTFIRVGKELLVLTAAHVVEGARTGSSGRGLVKLWKVEWEEDEDAEVVWYWDPEGKGGHDLALLRPLGGEDYWQDQPAARLGLEAPLRVGEDCWYVGTPAGVHGALERSLLSRVHDYCVPEYKRSHFTVFGGNGWYGSSGGGLYVVRDGRYVLIGVVNLLIRPHNPKSPCAAEPPDIIQSFLNQYLKQKRSR